MAWDGDLRLRTRMDVLPVDGMQEVRSSNLRSSTPGKRHIFESLIARSERLIQQQSTAAASTISSFTSSPILPSRGQESAAASAAGVNQPSTALA